MQWSFDEPWNLCDTYTHSLENSLRRLFQKNKPEWLIRTLMKCRGRESDRGVRLRVTEVKWVTAESDTDYPECICSLRIRRCTQYSLRWMLSVPFTSSSFWDFSSPSHAGVKKIFWAAAHIYMCHMRETCNFASVRARRENLWSEGVNADSSLSLL